MRIVVKQLDGNEILEVGRSFPVLSSGRSPAVFFESHLHCRVLPFAGPHAGQPLPMHGGSNCAGRLASTPTEVARRFFWEV
jgi:hypothetical protein